MSSSVKGFPSKGFSTVVLSDLHLTEEHVSSQKYPLWKKFKTREFFFDQDFADMLEFQQNNAEGKIELVLNGDIFDFDSITAAPKNPAYRVSEFEKSTTLFAQQEKSLFKIEVIIKDHAIWFDALKKFVEKGNAVVFVVGNHDLELHYKEVQRVIRKRISDEETPLDHIRFCEWFYLSHQDTHIEHGNQYDPYCVCQTPINPFIRVHNDLRVRIPFGDLAARYMVNAMGFVNPHMEENYTMTLSEYLSFFFKFLIKKQPLIIWTWFKSSVIVAYRSILYRLREPVINPLAYEDRVSEIAIKSRVEPKVVRELATLAAPSAVSSPWSIMQVLWIDRALIFLFGVLLCFQFFLILDQLVDIRIYWMLIPLLMLAPFFIFYSSTVKDKIKGSKTLSGEKMRWLSLVTGAERVVFGHTHEVRHEVIGLVEYLNPGSWSPVFEDIECTKPLTRYPYVLIKPEGERRKAYLKEWRDGKELDYFSGKKS